MQTMCNTIGGVVGSTGEAVTDGIGAWIAKSMGEMAQAAAELASKAVDRTTAIDLNAEWFRSNYELLLPIGLILTVGTFCLQLARAAWRRDECALAQAVSGTVAGVVFAFAAIACTTVAITVVDALSAGLFKAANTSIVFLLGVSAMGKSDASDGISALSDVLAGVVVMVLVMLCPYATYKFVHWAADGSGHDDLHRTGVAGVAVAAGAAKTAGQLAMQAGTGMRAPQGPSKVPGQGWGGVASGIDPTGGSHGDKPKQTHFRFGEDPNATGDKGRALIRRPPTDGDRGQPLIQRPGQGTAADAAPVSSGPTPQGAAVAQPRVTHLDPPTPRRPGPVSGTPPQGGATSQRWVYPEPPGGSGS
jgi:hypothetical protein